MSYEAINAVLKHSQAKGPKRLLLLVIAHHAHADGTGARPSLETLAAETGIDRAQIPEYLAVLREIGEIEWKKGGKGRANEYSLLGFFGKEVQFSSGKNTGVKLQPEKTDRVAKLPPQHNRCLTTVTNTSTTYKQTRVREAAATAETAVDVGFSKEKAETTVSRNGETALIANGVKPDVARDLAVQFPERIAAQLDCLDDRKPTDRAAVLVASIRNDWTLPPSYRRRKNAEHEAALTAREEVARVLAARTEADERRAASEAKSQTTQLEDAMNARLDAFYEDLDASTRADIDAAAKLELGPLAQRAGAGAVSAIRRRLLRERGLAPT